MMLLHMPQNMDLEFGHASMVMSYFLDDDYHIFSNQTTQVVRFLLQKILYQNQIDPIANLYLSEPDIVQQNPDMALAKKIKRQYILFLKESLGTDAWVYVYGLDNSCQRLVRFFKMTEDILLTKFVVEECGIKNQISPIPTNIEKVKLSDFINQAKKCEKMSAKKGTKEFLAYLKSL